MKTPGFEWEPARGPYGRRHAQTSWSTAIAYVGIGVSVFVLYAFGMVIMIDWMTMRFVETTRLLH